MRNRKINLLEVLIILVIGGLVVITLAGWLLPAGCRNRMKHLQSSTIGLDRKVMVYSEDGELIKTYEGRFKIEGETPYKTQFVLDGKSIYISGGLVIVEEQ